MMKAAADAMIFCIVFIKHHGRDTPRPLQDGEELPSSCMSVWYQFSDSHRFSVSQHDTASGTVSAFDHCMYPTVFYDVARLIRIMLSAD